MVFPVIFFLLKKDMANKTIGAIMIREIIRLKSEPTLKSGFFKN
jgi:hypothetical protein